MKTGYDFFSFSLATRRIFVLAITLSSVICVDDEIVYMNQFAVHIDGTLEMANRIAAKHGFINHGQIGDLDSHYLFEHNHVKKRATDPSHHHHEKLNGESEVLWVQQQSVLKRVKRDLNYPDFDSGTGNGRVSFLSNFGTNFRPSYSGEFPDPLYGKQWYLHKGAADRWDMNVLGAWKKGYTGYGVVVSILDDGIQTNHPDIVRNYDPLASTDINGNDDDPMPQDNGDNKHGTRCAGEVAATAFNDICGVGIAFNASIGGVRMLDGTVNDAVEAKALSLNRNHIDIYSASWGPEDDGKTVDGPGPMARRAFIDGVTQGRNYKGSIFVWASGNGGRHTDNCNCDGYTNSIFTLSISSVTQRGLKPWYLEECSSTLTTTYSSGTPGHDKNVITVDMDPTFSRDTMCTQDHTGTSASAPIAAAICALALEANPNLTWRDMQYLVVLTSRPEPLMKEDGWQVNGVNRKVSHKFGYGLMDATAMVNLAEQWLSVPNQHICETLEDAYQRPIPKSFGEKLEIYMNTDACWNTANVVNYLEHVQCRLTLHHNPRGNLKITLESPSGTRSVLLSPRPKDIYQTDFQDWPFLSVHFWGERAAGQWKLTIVNAGSNPTQQPGVLKKWSLVFHGTEQHPIHLRSHSSSEYQFSPVGRSAGTVVQIREDSQSEDCHRECRGGCYGNGADKCQDCRHFHTDSEPRMCVRTCSEGEFANVNNTCTLCHASCKTCFNASASACLSCDDTLLVQDQNECVENCPRKYYSRDSDRTCNKCSTICDGCTGESNNCNRCREDLLFYGSKCVASCPPSTFESADRRCLDCHNSCETCTGASESDCLTCSQNLVHFNGTCVDSCPSGFFRYNSEVNECYACDPPCVTCNSTHCLSCRPLWSLTDSGKCQLHNRCGSKQFLSDGERCLPCHKSCDSCDGISYSQCLTCPPYLILYKNTCVKKCPPNTVYVANECIQCHETCLKCSGPNSNQCNSCRIGLILKNGFCSTVCGNSMYSSGNVCLRCHETCITCHGPTASDCNTCVSGLQLGDGKCEKSCTPGSFPRNSSCFKCHHSCLTCKGNGLNDCISCADNLILDSGICMECQKGLFYDKIAQQCRQCAVTCTTCNGPDEFSCLSCTRPLKLDLVQHRCVPCCKSLLQTNCCVCDARTDSCINEVNAEKRRIDSSLEQSLFDIDSKLQAGFSYGTFSIVAVCTCLVVILIFFVALKMLKQHRSKYRDWKHDYQLLPLEKSDLSLQEDFWEGTEHIRT